MHPSPPFVLPPDGWRARTRGLLAGIGLQARALALVGLAAIMLAGVVWVRGTPRNEPEPWTPPDGTAGAGVPSGPGGAPGVPSGGVGGDPGPGSAPDGSGTAGPGTAGTGALGQIAVHVAGRVRRPGLVLLPAGSRVADALAAAGGPVAGADLDRVNLARKLTDGEQVLVLRVGEPTPAPPPGGTGTAPGGPGTPADPGAKVNLNTATVEQLEALPGVGAVTAERIVAYRSRRPFRSVQDLLQVEGIGERRFESLRNLVTV